MCLEQSAAAFLVALGQRSMALTVSSLLSLLLAAAPRPASRSLHSETAMHCDTRSDDFLVVKWPDKKAKEAATCHLVCVVTLGAVLF
jgi:hypothetical protein